MCKIGLNYSLTLKDGRCVVACFMGGLNPPYFMTVDGEKISIYNVIQTILIDQDN